MRLSFVEILAVAVLLTTVILGFVYWKELGNWVAKNKNRMPLLCFCVVFLAGLLLLLWACKTYSYVAFFPVHLFGTLTGVLGGAGILLAVFKK